MYLPTMTELKQWRVRLGLTQRKVSTKPHGFTTFSPSFNVIAALQTQITGGTTRSANGNRQNRPPSSPTQKHPIAVGVRMQVAIIAFVRAFPLQSRISPEQGSIILKSTASHIFVPRNHSLKNSLNPPFA